MRRWIHPGPRPVLTGRQIDELLDLIETFNAVEAQQLAGEAGPAPVFDPRKSVEEHQAAIHAWVQGHRANVRAALRRRVVERFGVPAERPPCVKEEP